MVAPKLRFKEFNNDWSLKKLGDLSFKPQYGMNSSATEFDGENKYLRITDINEDDHSFNFSKLTSPADDLDDKYLLKNGDLLFARTGASVGKSYLYNSKDGKVYFAGFLIKFSLQTEVNPYFIFSQTLSKKFQNWVITNSMRSGQPGINAEEYSLLPISFTSLKEQTKIATFLAAVDEKITQLTQKHQLLSQYKQGMMQKLFSQKIRFKADDGSEYEEWDFIELGEALSYEQPTKYIVSSTEYLDTYPTPVLTAGKSFILGYTNEQTGIFDASNNNVIIFDDFTTAYKFVNFRFKVKSSAMKILKTNLAQNNIYYLYSTFSTLNFPIGDEHKRRWISEYSKQEIPLPCLAEQTKIANFLSAIDQKIEVVAQQIEQAKQWKKGLLQQMFV